MRECRPTLRSIINSGRYVEFDGIQNYVIDDYMIIVEDTFASHPDPLNGICIFRYPDGVKKKDIKYVLNSNMSKTAAYKFLEQLQTRDGADYVILKWDYAYLCYREY